MKILNKSKPAAENQNPNPKTFMAQFLSPAMGLAILGTVALIFSFYRAGQLSNLVIPQDQIKEKAVHKQNRPQIDINSEDIVDAADASQASIFAIAGDYKEATDQALKDLTENPPDYLPTVFEAGDIITQFSDDKELGFGLLERAVTMAPNNQYINLRYCLRLANAGRISEAEPSLVHLIKKYPQWIDPRIVQSRLHFIQGKTPQATTELIELTNNKDLNSKQAEQIALLLFKLGRAADAFTVFQKAVKGNPQNSFFAVYCKDWVEKNPGSYETVLAIVKTNLAENRNTPNISKQLGLEIKHGALLLLLGRGADAQAALGQAINTYPKNFDLHILQAAAYVLTGDNIKAKAAFQNAAECYPIKVLSTTPHKLPDR